MSKKTAKPKEEMSLWDRINDYEILSDEIIDGKRVTKLRTHSGAIVVCRNPIRTEEERRELSAKLAEALTRLAYPDRDLSQYDVVRVVW